MDVLVHYSHSIEPFFFSGRAEFVVVVKVYGEGIKVIETSVWGEIVDSGGGGIVGIVCKR